MKDSFQNYASWKLVNQWDDEDGLICPDCQEMIINGLCGCEDEDE